MATVVDTTITLIAPGARTQDAKGRWRSSAEITRQIFARKESISRSEFFSGGQNGFRPEMMILVFAGDYQGEAVAEHDGTRYAIYRTYHRPGTDDLELYMQREIGVRAPAEEGAGNGAENGG